MSYEIHEQHRVLPPSDDASVRWATVDDVLTFKLGNHHDDKAMIYVTDVGGAAITVPVNMKDVMDAYLKLLHLHGFAYGLSSAIGAEEREQMAQAVEEAATALQVAGDEDVATMLRAKMLQLIDKASRSTVPVTAVDPENFDEPIRTWRGMKLESENMTEEERANAGIFSPEVCTYYIDAWQSARKNVLGELLPEGA